MMSWRRLDAARDQYAPRRCSVVTAVAAARWYGFVAVNPASKHDRRSCFRHHGEHRLPVPPPRFFQERLHGVDEGAVFARGQFNDLAAGRLDRLARMLVLLDRQPALI